MTPKPLDTKIPGSTVAGLKLPPLNKAISGKTMTMPKLNMPVAGPPMPKLSAYDVGVKLAMEKRGAGFFGRLSQGVRTLGGAVTGGARETSQMLQKEYPHLWAKSNVAGKGTAMGMGGLDAAQTAWRGMAPEVQQTLGRTAKGIGGVGLVGGGYMAGRPSDPTYEMGPLQWRGPSVSQLFNR